MKELHEFKVVNIQQVSLLYYLCKASYSIESCLIVKKFEFEEESLMKKNVVSFSKVLLDEKPHNFDHVPQELKDKGVIFELAKLFETDMELVWCQKNLRFSYEAFLYFPLLISNVLNEKKNIENPSSFKNHFLIKGVGDSTKEVVQKLEHIYYNEECREYVESNDFWGNFQHEIVKNIRKITSFNLFYIDVQHIATGFDNYADLDVEFKDPVPKNLIYNFNKWIRDFIIKCHKSGVLEINFAKESLFNLLIYLNSEYHAPHKLTFHSKIADSCPHQTAHIGTEEKFEQLIKNEKFSHVYSCFLKEELHHRGSRYGEEITSSCLALGIRDNDSFEFVKYQFYEYSAAGDILS